MIFNPLDIYFIHSDIYHWLHLKDRLGICKIAVSHPGAPFTNMI